MNSTILEIEKKIEKLTLEEFSILNKWIAEYENNIWDEKIKKDSLNQNLENLANNALLDLKNDNVNSL